MLKCTAALVLALLMGLPAFADGEYRHHRTPTGTASSCRPSGT